MRLPRLRLVVLSAALACGSVAVTHAATEKLPLLRGILIDSSGNLFSLSDATGAATWVQIGQSFGGWRLDAFDADRQVLKVSRDGVTQELSLESSVIKGEKARASFAEADALLNQMRFEEMISKSLDAQQKAMAQAFTQMGGKNLPADEATRLAEIQSKAMRLMVEEMDLPAMRKELAQAMTEIYTPAELRAQTDFYSTPAGRATIEKQPELQTRMTELMMPRMMRAMPKIQAMMMEEMTKPKPAAPSAPAKP